jgi:hypothetical protein
LQELEYLVQANSALSPEEHEKSKQLAEKQLQAMMLEHKAEIGRERANELELEIAKVRCREAELAVERSAKRRRTGASSSAKAQVLS